MLKFIARLIRALFIVAIAAAAAARFLLDSNAEPETEEIDLVSIFEGKHLVSSADPFYGGKVLIMFGGALLDLRNVQPSPTGVNLDIMVVMGGLNIVVPEGWRVVFKGDSYLGGWSDQTRTTADDDVPTVIVTGFVALGGLRAATKSPVQVVP